MYRNKLNLIKQEIILAIMLELSTYINVYNI